MGIPPDGAGGGGGGLGRTEGRATGGERSTEKGVGRVGAERVGVTVVDQSVDWNASFASCAVTPYKRLGKISDILHLNNENNQLERRVRSSKDIH